MDNISVVDSPRTHVCMIGILLVLGVGIVSSYITSPEDTSLIVSLLFVIAFIVGEGMVAYGCAALTFELSGAQILFWIFLSIFTAIFLHMDISVAREYAEYEISITLAASAVYFIGVGCGRVLDVWFSRRETHATP